MAERFAGVIDVRIGHRGILAHHEHAANLALLRRVDGFDHGEARIGIELECPTASRTAAGPRACPRADSRDRTSGSAPQSDAPCTLFCPRSGCKSRAGLADLARRKRQSDQAARVVGAVDVLGDTHAPEDDRRLGSRVQPGDLADGLRVNAADRRHRFRRKLLHVLRQRFVTGGAVANERLVDRGLPRQSRAASRSAAPHPCRI